MYISEPKYGFLTFLWFKKLPTDELLTYLWRVDKMLYLMAYNMWHILCGIFYDENVYSLYDWEDTPYLNSLIITCLIANLTKKDSNSVRPYTKNNMTDKIMNISFKLCHK